ncbi:MAG: DUF4190 domain-containing protein [Planctomycetota bacterium]
MSQPQPVPYATPSVEPKSSGIALASMIVGICSIPVGCVIPLITAIAAIVLSIIGFKQTSEGKRPGRGFAVAGLFTGIFGLIVPTLLLASIMLPSLYRARETANRVRCASNMRQIGLAAILYANEDPDGAFPPDLETILLTQVIASQVFVSPSGTAVASTAPAGTPLTLGVDVSYVWVGDGQTWNAPPSRPILFALPANHGDEGGNILYADGHVSFEPLPAFAAEVNELLNNGEITQEQANQILGK